MIRILGVNLKSNKKIYVALTAIYGIGFVTALKILKKAEIDENIKTKDLNDSQIMKLKKILESDEFILEGDLKRIIFLNIQHLIETHSRRGLRHISKLPVRGQRTRTNSQTVRRAIKKS